MLKKQIKTLVMMICLCSIVLLAAEGTSAYFTAEEKAHNVITTGGIDIELTEWMEEENGSRVPFENVEGIMPGTEVSKIPMIENTGEADAYIRIKVEKQFVGPNGELNEDVISVNYNTTDWTEQNGYFYYNEVLKPGETTKPVFTTVTFDKLMGNDYQNATATIDVQAYATQAANNGDSALTAKGWPVD